MWKQVFILDHDVHQPQYMTMTMTMTEYCVSGSQLLRPQCEINFANKEQHEETHRVTGYVAGGAVETFGIYHF